MTAEEAAPRKYAAADLDYEQRVFAGGTRLTRWSHRSRARCGSRGLTGQHLARAADVGGANGWFLRHLLDAGTIGTGVVLDVDDALLEAGRQEARDLPNLEFHHSAPEVIDELKDDFDLVVCLETLEHVEDPAAVLDTMVALARPGGLILVSVPVEVGPALLIKQAGRWAANRDGSYGYERYAWKELLQAALFWDADGIGRANLHSHKGFDYRRIRRQLKERATITRTWYSPVDLAGPITASTVFWLAEAPAA